MVYLDYRQIAYCKKNPQQLHQGRGTYREIFLGTTLADDSIVVEILDSSHPEEAHEAFLDLA
jgi:hypothetical protein